jgi:predicted site-specific integrase-resolvase
MTNADNDGNTRPHWFRAEAAARHLGISKALIYKWMADGLFPSVTIKDPGSKKGVRLIDREKLDEFLKSQEKLGV